MKNYTFNKQPKDPRLCKILRKAINLDRKRNGFEWDDIANELGLNGGTLDNKLKPSYDQGDFTLSEFMHFMEISGDMSALEYIANKFDLILIPKVEAEPKSIDIDALVDMASIENGDVFKSVKLATADNIVTKDEARRALKELYEAQKANANLQKRLEALLDDEIIS